MACRDGPDDFVARQIETHIRAGIDAINTRSFDPSCAPWHALADDFHTINPTGGRVAVDSKNASLVEMEQICRAYPDHQITIIDLATTIYPERIARRADVFMNAEATGGPGLERGISRKFVSCFAFECRNGVWLCVSETSMDGLGQDAMPK